MSKSDNESVDDDEVLTQGAKDWMAHVERERAGSGLNFRDKVFIAAVTVAVGALITYVNTESLNITAGVGGIMFVLAAAILYLHHLDAKAQAGDVQQQETGALEADESFVLAARSNTQ